ncbi:MAG: hypothetical protein ACRDHY_14270 [Anaerolineales bacterium]
MQRRKVQVIDAPGSEPYAAVGDLLVAVRTPRSRDFVTVEVGLLANSQLGQRIVGPIAQVPTPAPWVAEPWRGEVHVGQSGAVKFRIDQNTYRLTLTRLDETAEGFPWIACEFILEQR